MADQRVKAQKSINFHNIVSLSLKNALSQTLNAKLISSLKSIENSCDMPKSLKKKKIILLKEEIEVSSWM